MSAGSGAATFNSPSSLGVLEDVAKHTLVAKYNDINSVKELFEKIKILHVLSLSLLLEIWG